MSQRVFLLLICLSCVPCAIADASPGIEGPSIRIITLNGLEIGLDEQTGGIVSMRHPATGDILRTSPQDAGPLDVAYPVTEFLPLRLASRFSGAHVTEEPGKVTITWDKLGPSRDNVPLPEGRVTATVEICAVFPSLPPLDSCGAAAICASVACSSFPKSSD